MKKRIYLNALLVSVLMLINAIGCGNKAETKSKEAIKEETPRTNVRVELETSAGIMQIKLYDDTPKHRDNFIKLVESGFYKDCLFHRVIRDFMIQAGDPESKKSEPQAMLGSGGPGYTLDAEINSKHFHKKGAIAAARLGDQQNPKRASSGSQFYIVQGKPINLEQLFQIEAHIQKQAPDFKYSPEAIESYQTIGGTPHLDQFYTVFGELILGYDVLDKIAASEVGQQDRPVENVKIINMKIIP